MDGSMDRKPAVTSQKYAHAWFALCWGYVLMDLTHILQGHFTGTGAIIWLPQYQWNNPEQYGWIDYINPQRNIKV